jgi:nitronate monooxygenase
MLASRDLLDLLGINLPIIQAPMAGASGTAMAIAVSNAGGLGSIPCAMLDPATLRNDISTFRQQSVKPVNLNFFCHDPAAPDPVQRETWTQELASYRNEFGLEVPAEIPPGIREPFGSEMCDLVEKFRPEVVSFHFGLPNKSLLSRVKSAGCVVIASATTVAEARWLEDNGCDAIIAQGYEAGGHRGIFLSDDISTQSGSMALVPQIVDAVTVPVIAAGGITDGRGVAAAFILGAAAAQIGTAYLFTPEAIISDLHRKALTSTQEGNTALTNVFSGRPARSIVNRIMRDIGPMSQKAPAFPTAGVALATLKRAAEKNGASDFSSLWSGQAANLGTEISAADLTRQLAEGAEMLLRRGAPPKPAS